MKNKFLLLTWLLAVPLLWGGCETTTPTPEQQLPGLTITGENTFGCLVNGEAWLPEGGNPFGPGTKLRASFHYPSNQLGVTAFKENDVTHEGISFELVLNEENSEVKYLNTAFFLDIDCSFIDITHHLDTLSPHGFQVEFLDLEEKIVSGTFYFTAISSECQEDTIVISEGRYDIKFAN
ncbi:hypothetical protein [Phaeodactylibacter xiamenensis]|uniref:hypothetical protein n=1 Tax=Phaeodactylibacter xiamenensis TaxID=1524460 RepID=UPI0024A7D4E2|nr:hypothetical protein [Phaeodactylibacter xiamenensis]